MSKGVFIYGFGGHARVIADILASEGKALLGFIDDDSSKWGKSGSRPEVRGYEAFLGLRTEEDALVIVGIGDNGARRRIAAKMEASGKGLFDTAVHASAVIGGNTSFGPGTVVMAGAVINCGSMIGRQSTSIRERATIMIVRLANASMFRQGAPRKGRFGRGRKLDRTGCLHH